MIGLIFLILTSFTGGVTSKPTLNLPTNPNPPIVFNDDVINKPAPLPGVSRIAAFDTCGACPDGWTQTSCTCWPSAGGNFCVQTCQDLRVKRPASGM